MRGRFAHPPTKALSGFGLLQLANAKYVHVDKVAEMLYNRMSRLNEGRFVA